MVKTKKTSLLFNLLLVVFTTSFLLMVPYGINIDQKNGSMDKTIIQAAEDGEKDGDDKTYKANVPIPGVSVNPSQGTKAIGEYVKGIYNYAIGIVGILAAVVLMFGGVRWLTAGGNPDRIESAKAWIGASITGLVIALASYMILFTINPSLVNFHTMQPGGTEDYSGGICYVSGAKNAGCKVSSKKACEEHDTADKNLNWTFTKEGKCITGDNNKKYYTDGKKGSYCQKSSDCNDNICEQNTVYTDPQCVGNKCICGLF